MGKATAEAAGPGIEATVGKHPLPGSSRLAGMASTRFDWVVITLAGWLLVGLYLDGWAHLHVLELDTFFTPWHGLLYSGMLAVAVFLAASAVRYHAAGYPWQRSLPFGYGTSLLGVALFGVGGVADMTWHLVFGIEQGVDALLSPTHLWLATAGVMIGTGPLRSAWRKVGPTSYRAVWPGLLSLAYLLSVLTFFTQFAHPLVEPLAAQRQTVIGSEIYAMGADGSGQTRLIATADTNNRAASWHPDGRRMAFASDRDGMSQVYVSEGGAVTQLTSGDAPNSYPAFSPDGSKIAFVSRRDGNSEVYVMNSDGSGQTNLTNTPGVDEGLPSWAPDGGRILYTSQSRAADLGSFGQALGIASVLLQAGLLMGTLLVGLRRWTLPLGSVTLLFTLSAALMGMLNDRFLLVPGAVVAGVVGDALLRGLGPSPERRGALRIFAFTVPAVYYALYFLSLALTEGVRWPVELWAGSIVIAGLTGLLVSYVLVGLAVPATRPQQS